jgi:WD40 repeat protein
VILIAFAALLTAAPDIVLQSGHGANISAIAFSPDGKYLVSASEDSTLKLWDPNTGAELRTLRGHSNIVTAIALSADGSEIASASLDHTLRVWNAATGEPIAVFRGPLPSVYLLKMTPDAASLITAETVAAGTVLRMWDIKSGKQTRIIKREDAAVSHIFFTGSTMLVAEESGEDDTTGALTSFNLSNGKKLQTRPALLCGASDDGKWVAVDRSTEIARSAVIVDLPNDKPLAQLSGQVSRVAFSSTGEYLAYESSSGDTAVVRKTMGGPAKTIRGRGAEFSMIALSPDGRWLASAGADFSIHIWDVATGKLAHATSGQYTPTAVAFTSDERRVAVNGGGTDLGSAIQIWDIARKARVSSPKVKRTVAALAFSEDGKYLAVSSPSVEVFDTRTNESVAKFDCGSATALNSVFSPNGKWLAANCGGVITVWSMSGGGELFHFGNSSDPNNGPVSFSPDGGLIATGASTGLTIYDVTARKVTQSMKTTDPVSALAFDASGELLALGLKRIAPKPDDSLPTLFLVNLRAHHRIWSVPAGSSVSALRFAPGGRVLLVAANSLAQFDTANGKLLHSLAGRIPNVSAPTFSADGEWFGAGWNSAINLWRTRFGPI